jgi:hypothetical protein
MAKKKPTRTAPDPADQHNAEILRRRQERLDERLKEIPNLGLDLGGDGEPSSAAEALRDEFDKVAFGEEAPTVTRTVYGPDPLLDQCPGMQARIQEIGLEEYAEMTYRTILEKGHEAVPDPVMRRGLYATIYGTKRHKGFGIEAVATAFRDRIMRIPQRQVEYEVDGDIGDPFRSGSNVLRECVMAYGNEPGMSYRFLSQRCIDVLGMRGYVLVLKPDGDVAKAGTLLMGKIPTHIIQARCRHYADQSRQAVREQEESYLQAQERYVRAAGSLGESVRPLASNEKVRGNASEREELLGEELTMGVKLERQR